jgi:hypothetical protein
MRLAAQLVGRTVPVAASFTTSTPPIAPRRQMTKVRSELRHNPG